MHAILAMCALLVLAAVPAAKVPEITAQINQGRDAIRNNQPEIAESLLKGALDAARRANDSVAAARALFFLGLLNQERSQSASGPLAKELRTTAVGYYRESLELYSESGSTMHNLAEMYAALGDYGQAKKYLTRAMEMDAPRRALFAEKLGDIALAANQYKDAAEAYETAAHAKEPPPGIQQKLINALLAAKEEDGLVEHLWKAVKEDQMDVALSGALTALSEDAVDGDEVDALFGVVAASLARQNYTQGQLAEIGIAQRLVDLGSRRAYEARVQAIMALYAADFSRPETFQSWRDRIDDDDVPEDLSPRRALADLAGALGRRAYHEQNYPRAEGYFRFVLSYAHVNNPRAVLDLAALYFAQKRLPELDRLLIEFENELYGEKSAAIAGGDLLRQYEYHRTLGEMYALLGRWTDPIRSPTTALHQLERAVEAAEEIDALRRQQGKPPFEPEPDVKRLLGDAYAAAGHADDAVRLRFEAAEMYARAEDLVSVRQVMATIPVSALESAEVRERYAALVAPTVTFIGGVGAEWDAKVVKGCIVVLSTTKDVALRNEATRKLEQLGLRLKLGPSNGTILSSKAKPVSFYLPTGG